VPGRFTLAAWARPTPASAEHKPVAAADEHELTKTEVYGSSPKDQYDGNFRLFLGNDLADRGEGISLIREQVEPNPCFHCEIVGGLFPKCGLGSFRFGACCGDKAT
jgi:hypothetical protein